MLNGPWGSGKTYYFEQLVKPKMEKEEKLKGKTVLYVSLNGLQGPGEVFQKLVEQKLWLVNKATYSICYPFFSEKF